MGHIKQIKSNFLCKKIYGSEYGRIFEPMRQYTSTAETISEIKIGGVWFSFEEYSKFSPYPNLLDYFYTKKEERKIKLDSLE